MLSQAPRSTTLSKGTIPMYERLHRERSFSDGHWALGTGNSLTNYMPVENYITALKEGLRT